VGSYPFPLGIEISLLSMRHPIFLVARDQASIECEPCIVLNVFCLQMKILRETPFVLDRLKRLLVVQIMENTV